MKHLEYFFAGACTLIFIVGSVLLVPYAIGTVLTRFEFVNKITTRLGLGPVEGDDSRWFAGWLAMMVVGLVGLIVCTLIS